MRMIRILSTAALALSLWGCGQKSAGLQEGAVAPDTELFENGMKYLEKNQYLKAQLAFQTLINAYPDSEYTPIAFLSIADSFYAEGGTEKLLQAEAQYKDFIIFYPTHEMADDAQMKIVAVNIRLMRAPDRDPTYARKAETELKKLFKDYPDSELVPTAREFEREVTENLAQGIQMKADFYYTRGSFLASESRYKEVLKDYPDYSRTDETLYRLASSLEQVGRVEEASVYYARISAEYPFSEYFEASREKLVLLEKNVPEINEAAAERHAANRRQDDFSIFDPLREVWRTFTGRPDPYEVARRRAEERRSADAAATDENGPPDGGH